ncbi:uncharacterized protein LOC122655719 [Telopea speciosissima]|uniref:uncharacterized protein LOC122655719 n=1 Tax=Telopea speciosissima TaxID=54955 RepID=UPI001CC677CA|nr:uncharacterized protein LOC122655719 [Telopea speciosissima]
MIVPEVLTKYNYGEWKIYMKSYLLGEGLWDIVKGIESKPEDPTSPEFKSWREKNAKALHAILISCEEEMLSSIQKRDSAKDAWDHLALMSQGRTSPIGEENMAEDAVPVTRYRALYQAAFWGDWKRTKSLLDDDDGNVSSSSSLITAILLPSWGTVLHVAVSAGHLNLVEKLVDMMTPDTISTITRTCPISALNLAARGGFTKIAEVLVKKNIYSLEIPDDTFGLIPVATACRSGHKDTTRYLYAVTIKETLIQGDRKCGATLLNNAIAYEMYDIVIDLLSHFPRLAIAYDYGGWTTIRVLASMPNAFPSGGLYTTWQHWIYSCAPIYNEKDISSLDMGTTNKDQSSIEAFYI